MCGIWLYVRAPGEEVGQRVKEMHAEAAEAVKVDSKIVGGEEEGEVEEVKEFKGSIGEEVRVAAVVKAIGRRGPDC
jgi:hypothetical protein